MTRLLSCFGERERTQLSITKRPSIRRVWIRGIPGARTRVELSGKRRETRAYPRNNKVRQAGQLPGIVTRAGTKLTFQTFCAVEVEVQEKSWIWSAYSFVIFTRFWYCSSQSSVVHLQDSSKTPAVKCAMDGLEPDVEWGHGSQSAENMSNRHSWWSPEKWNTENLSATTRSLVLLIASEII